MTSQPNRFLRLLGAFTAFAAVAGGALILLRSPSTKAQSIEKSDMVTQSPALLVEALSIREMQIQCQNALSGQVEPYRIATVAAEVAGRIVRRPIESGDKIRRSVLLVSLDSEAAAAAQAQAQAAAEGATAARRQAESEYARAVIETDANRQQARAQVMQATATEKKTRTFTRTQELRQAEAALAQARTDERLAKIEYDRYVWLVKEGAAPQQTLDRVQATFEAATARRESAEQSVSLANEGARQEDIQTAAAGVEVARAGLQIAETRNVRLASIRRQIDGLRAQEAQAAAAVRQAKIALSKRQILAPFAGRVLATLAETGEMLSPGTPVARIGEITRVKATFSVPERARKGLCLDQTVSITADALPGKTFAGRITLLGFQADVKTRAFPIEVTIANPEERLLPNMVVRLNLLTEASTHRLLIPISAVATSETMPYVFVLSNGKAIRRDVTLGAAQGERVEIRSGLRAGDKIAATPQRLTDGVTVRIEGANR